MLAVFSVMAVFSTNAVAQDAEVDTLNARQEAIVSISALTGTGDLLKLKKQLNAGLEVGLTISQIKEILVHVYAYAGFPRSIRGLQTFMTVLEERSAKGLSDQPGYEPDPINTSKSKYARGKAVLDSLLGAPQNGPQKGYAAFAPVIEVFLKEHLFADIFERDVLSYTQRELATIAVLAGIGGVEPMLQSHLKICLNLGLAPGQLQQFTDIIQRRIGKKEAKAARKVLTHL